MRRENDIQIIARLNLRALSANEEGERGFEGGFAAFKPPSLPSLRRVRKATART
jgi:hypothetical protein